MSSCFRLLVLAVILTVISGIPSAIATVAKILQDLSDLELLANNMNAAVTAIYLSPGPTMADFYTALTDLAYLNNFGNDAYDVSSMFSLSEADADTIYTPLYGRLSPFLLSAIPTWTFAKTKIQGIPRPPSNTSNIDIVRRELDSVAANAVIFEDALIAVAPTSRKQLFIDYKNTIDACFNQTIAAFSQ